MFRLILQICVCVREVKSGLKRCSIDGSVLMQYPEDCFGLDCNFRYI